MARLGLGRQQSASHLKPRGGVAGRHEAVVADFREAAWQDVTKPALKEGDAVKRDELSGLGAKSHAALINRDEAVVGDGNTMGVLAKVANHLFGIAERALAVDAPLLAMQAGDEGGEAAWIIDTQLTAPGGP
jgi:hypothetical protein